MSLDIERVGIIGMGLIGGSLARDLAARNIPVTAFDRALDPLASVGIDNVALVGSLDAVAATADVLVIAIPVSDALDVLESVAPFATRARLITDVGSTKRSIVTLAERVGIGERFVGGHPMAGDHRFGWSASRRDLFVDAPVYLCPTTNATPATLSLAREFWASLGARTLTMDAAHHDAHLVWTSHLPHAVAAALARSLDSVDVSRADLGRGGREMTRVAGSSPDMWAQIWMDNAEPVIRTLHQMETELGELRDRIQRGDVEAVREWFAHGREWFEKSGRLT